MAQSCGNIRPEDKPGIHEMVSHQLHHGINRLFRKQNIRHNYKGYVMTWFAAHIVMYVKYKTGKQEKFPVWENIYLIQSSSSEEAYNKAKSIGKYQEGDSNGTFMWNEIPSIIIFGGIRKLIECQNSPEQIISNQSDENYPEDGSEISYSQFIVENKEDLKNLINGEEVKVIYSE